MPFTTELREAAFRPRAMLRMLTRNAYVVLTNVGAAEDLAVLEAMLAHEHEVVREHAAWATAQVQQRRLQLHRQAE